MVWYNLTSYKTRSCGTTINMYNMTGLCGALPQGREHRLLPEAGRHGALLIVMMIVLINKNTNDNELIMIMIIVISNTN